MATHTGTATTGTATTGSTTTGTTTAPGTTDAGTGDAALVGKLNDLLQLDHDAMAAYRLTLAELNSERLGTELRAHLADHERHAKELKAHIERRGGMPMPMPHASGVFKLAVQAAVAAADDKTVLLAFKSNEMQVRDKYSRAAADISLPADVHETVVRAAADEQRHYDWAVRSLEQLGASKDDASVRATKAFAKVHGRTADGMEAMERGAMTGFEGARRRISRDPVKSLLISAVAVVGAGLLLGRLRK